MGFPPLLNLSTRLSTAALPGQTTKTALTEEFMFQNVAYRPTVYRTGGMSIHAVVVFGLGKNLLFKSILGHCEIMPERIIYKSHYGNGVPAMFTS